MTLIVIEQGIKVSVQSLDVTATNLTPLELEFLKEGYISVSRGFQKFTPNVFK